MRLFIALLLLLLTAPAGAAPRREVLRPGDSDVLEFDGMTTTAIGSPAVADIVPLSSKRLLLNAKGPGRTTLFVFDRSGKHLVIVTVLPPAPTWSAEQIEREIAQPGVTAHWIHGVVFLEGTVGTAAESQRAQAIAEAYTPHVKNLIQTRPPAAKPLAPLVAEALAHDLAGTGLTVRALDDTTLLLGGHLARPLPASLPSDAAQEGADAAVKRDATSPPSPLTRLLASLPPDLRVINLVDLQPRPLRQVLVRAKIVDINRDSLHDLGVAWGTLNGTSLGAPRTFQPQPILFGQSPSDPSHGPTNDGPLRRLLPWAAELTALIRENKARVLSEPSLLVLDGQEGRLLVGGEIPIPVSQSNRGLSGAQVTVEYKPFGVRLGVSPTLLEEGRIALTVSPEVSSLDYGSGVQYGGLTIPALAVRRATSTLQMQDGQTLVIGGLYSKTEAKQVERIPLLSQVPVLGEFFKHTVTRKSDSELVILLEVEIAKADAEAKP